MFSPFADITAEEFRRVTEVSYLGFVYGTMAALSRMRPRDRGTIVQVGSALGDRSIPLQSAYCGAKHAINGFTSSLRCELLHEHSGVRVTVVQMPAVNTPQFSWVRSRLPNHPQPVPPIYQPEVAARGVVYAADHPGRKQYWVGASTTATILANRVAPALLDRYLARTGYGSTADFASPPTPASRTTCSSRSTGSTATISARTAPSTAALTTTARRPGCPGMPGLSAALVGGAAVLGGFARRAGGGSAGDHHEPAAATPVPEAVPAPLLSPALVPRVLFPAVRACYGAMLLCAPGPALGLSTGRRPARGPARWPGFSARGTWSRPC